MRLITSAVGEARMPHLSLRRWPREKPGVPFSTRNKEIAFEGAVPIASAGYCFWKLTSLMGAPSMGKPLTDIELAVMLGSMVALVSWAVSRQMFMKKLYQMEQDI